MNLAKDLRDNNATQFRAYWAIRVVGVGDYPDAFDDPCPLAEEDSQRVGCRVAGGVNVFEDKDHVARVEDRNRSRPTHDVHDLRGGGLAVAPAMPSRGANAHGARMFCQEGDEELVERPLVRSECPRNLEVMVQARKELGAHDGLGEKIAAARAEGRREIVEPRPRGQEDDRAAPRGLEAPELTRDFEARDLRHHDVEQDRVEGSRFAKHAHGLP